MSRHKPPSGLYEQLVNAALQAKLSDIGSDRLAKLEKLNAAEAPDRLAIYVGRLVERVVTGLSEKDRLDFSRRLVNSLIDVAQDYTETPSLELDKLPDELSLCALRSDRPARRI